MQEDQDDQAYNKLVVYGLYIQWLGASYDTHKGKRWLNSNPLATGAE